MSKSDRQHICWSIALLVIALILYLWKFGLFQLGTYMDDAQYVVLAKSIAEHRGYGLINPPDSVLPTRYPFGWPLILAPIYAISSGSFEALQAVALAFTVANILLVLVFWKALSLPNRSYGLAVAALYAFSPMVVGHAGMVMSEPAFLFFVLLGLILTNSLSKNDGKLSVVLSVVLGAVWVFAAYVRTIGVTLVLASGIYLLLRRKWQALGLALIGLCVTLASIVLITSISWTDLVNITEYSNQFQKPAVWGQIGVAENIAVRAIQGGRSYLGEYLRDALIPFAGGPTTRALLNRFGLGFLPSAISVFTSLLVLLGYALNIQKNGFLPQHVYLPAFMAITILWPWRGERFLYGIIPFLFGYLLIGGHFILQILGEAFLGKTFRTRWIPRIGVTLVVILLCAQLFRSSMIDSSLNHVPNFRLGTSWIRENTAANAVVAAEQPQIVFLYARRHTVSLPEDKSKLQTLAAKSPTYVLIMPELKWRNDGLLEYSNLTKQFLESLHSSVPPKTSLVFEMPDGKVKVFRVDNEDVR